MKTLKAICTAAILALAVSVPTYAGEILTPGLTGGGTPPPTACGDISCPGVGSTTPDSDDTSGFKAILLAIFSIF